MKTIVSSKGQMVIPAKFRAQLGISAGAELFIAVTQPGVFEAKVIPKAAKLKRYKIKIDKKTGFPFFVAPNAPKVTREQIDAALEDFP